MTNWKQNDTVPDYVLTLLDELSVPVDSVVIERVGPMPAEPGSMIPVVAVADAGPGIESYDKGFPAGFSDEYVSRPSGLKDVNAYCVRIKKDAESMSPVLRPGMLCIASPNTPPVSGDMAVVKLNNYARTIKVVHFNGDEVVLKSYNPDIEDVILDRKDLLMCHPIIWWRRPK